MEDRLTPFLYLELSQWDPDRYGAERASVLLDSPDTLRGSWWRNLRPNREEFPRNLPEFATLGLFEVTERFTPPAALEGDRGIHFRRVPRPAQGNLSGRPTLGLEFVLVSPKSEAGAQAFRDWADFIHIRHIAAASVPGFTMITPYENVQPTTPRYLHLYEIDTPDAEAAFQQMTPKTIERIGGPGTEAFREWAGHPELVIEYVNTFTRVGVAE